MNDTPLPSALDAEGSVLCAIFDDSSGLVLDQVRSILDGPNDFYSRANSFIYETVCALADEGKTPDPVSVAQRLNDNGRLKDVGGTKYIYETISLTIPAVVHVEQHALVVREKSRLRRMIATCKSFAAQAYGESGEGVQSFIEGAELAIGEIAHASDVSRLKPISKILQDVHAATNAASKVGSEIIGKTTGFMDLDKLTSGLHDGDLRIVAGRPGLGKSSFALCEAVGVARTGYAVPFFSLEMPELQLAYRLVALETKLPINSLRTGNLTTEQWKTFNEGIAVLSKMPIWIDDSASLSPAQLRSRTRRLMLEIRKGQHPHVTMGKVGVIYVDYLQLMTSPLAGQRFANREVEVSAISRELKNIAKVLSVPVTAMSQLNRGVESRADKRPLLSDLRECLTGDTLIAIPEVPTLAESEVSVRELAEFYDKSPVYSLDPLAEGEAVCIAHIDKIWSTGVKPVFEMRTLSGHVIRCTDNHPFFTRRGWTPLRELSVGTELALTVLGTGERLPGVTWSRVAAIAPAGEEEVFDLRVPLTHSFIANGFFTHNSGAIEQDADTVIFMYRAEYYLGAETPKEEKGICEFIVAKQRNGATDTVKLKFDGPTTRFDNLEQRFDTDEYDNFSEPG